MQWEVNSHRNSCFIQDAWLTFRGFEAWLVYLANEKAGPGKPSFGQVSPRNGSCVTFILDEEEEDEEEEDEEDDDDDGERCGCC